MILVTESAKAVKPKFCIKQSVPRYKNPSSQHQTFLLTDVIEYLGSQAWNTFLNVSCFKWQRSDFTSVMVTRNSHVSARYSRHSCSTHKLSGQGNFKALQPLPR
jgi:hypothetical protein